MFSNTRILLLAGLSLFSASHAFDIRPFAQLFFPNEISVPKESESVTSEQKWETGVVIEAGVEAFFISEFLPLQAGFGLGFRSTQSTEDSKATPAALPVWGVLSFGRIQEDSFFSPFVALRGGYLIPLSGDDAWWDSPVNFFANCGIGTVLPMGFTLEATVDYSSMQKSFPDDDIKYRVPSFRVGILLGFNIEISHSKIYKPHE